MTLSKRMGALRAEREKLAEQVYGGKLNLR